MFVQFPAGLRQHHPGKSGAMSHTAFLQMGGSSALLLVPVKVGHQPVPPHCLCVGV